MSTDLSVWLSEQVKDRGWSLRQTARRAGLSHSTVARLANGEIGWTLETCESLGKVFGLTLEDVLRIAGNLPPKPPPLRDRRIVYEVNGDERLLALWRALSVDDQARVRDLMERLAVLEQPKIIGEEEP